MIKRMESGIAGKGLSFEFLTWIREAALSLGLKGVAFTKNDGSVKVIAESEEATLEEFAKKLQEGADMFSTVVENFYATLHEYGEMGDFYISGEHQQ